MNMKDKNILVTYGGWDGHEPESFKDYMVHWLSGLGANIEVTRDLDIYANHGRMNELDLVIQVISMGKISDEQEEGLVRAVENGTGLAGWHGGLGDSFRNNILYQYMVGGQFVAHPGDMVRYKVEITDRDDPVTKGIADFEIESEQYYMHVDPNVKILASTVFSGGQDNWIEGNVMPVAWKKKHGRGRVFYASLGHTPADFDIPGAELLLKRGIAWAAQGKNK